MFAASRDPIRTQKLKGLGVHVLLDASSAYHIGETLPPKDAPKAHALLESSGHFGKVVLTMDDET